MCLTVPGMAAQFHQPKWHALEKGAEMARELVALCKAIKSEQKARKTRCRDAASRYEMRRLGGLNPAAYYRAGAYSGNTTAPLTWPEERSIANSAHSKLAGRQKPKAQFVTSDADWQTKRKSKKLDQFVEGQFMQSFGGYGDVWQLMLRVFLDACVFPTGGAVKTYADAEDGRVMYERVFTWELFTDPLESRYGQPRNLFHIYPYDRDELIERFPESKEALSDAPEFVEDGEAEWVGSRRVSNQIAVYEAWRLPFSKSKPGRHVIAIDDAVLVDEDWTRQSFPFIWLHWAKHLVGSDGTSLVEEIASIADVVNNTVQRMQDAHTRTSMSVLTYEEGSIREEDLRSNEDGINMRIAPGKAMPQYLRAEPYSQANVDFLQMNVDKLHDISGVSEMLSSADKPAGVTAAVALDRLSDIQSQRFSVIYRAYEDAFVALAQQTVACVRELAVVNADFESKWSGKGFLKSIKWSDVDLEEDRYVIQIYPVGEVKNTPADRLQLVSDLNSAGKISDDSLLEVIKYLDVSKELESVSRQRTLIESYIDDWLDATPEAEQDGTFRYRAPIPWMPSLADALVQVAQAYLEAEMEDAPEWNKDFFLRFMQELDLEIQKKDARAAANAAGQPMAPEAQSVGPTAQPGMSAAAPPPGQPPPPGMPPGPPPPAPPPGANSPPPQPVMQ